MARRIRAALAQQQLLPLLLLAIIAATATTATQTTTHTACPADFAGGTCAKCKTVDGAVTCAKCRQANSIWDDDRNACICNYEKDYGTVSKDMFDAYADELREACRRHGRRRCKVPSYSRSLAGGKCMRCPRYSNAVASLNGECAPLVGAGSLPGSCPEVRDTDNYNFKFINNTPEDIVVYTVPGWQCRDDAGGGFSGVSTPASLDKLVVPAFKSIAPRLEVINSRREGNSRFGLRFYSYPSGTTNPPALMLIGTLGNVAWISHGFRDPANYIGWKMQESPGGQDLCGVVPTTLSSGTDATMRFSCVESTDEGDDPELTFAPKQ
jgi:hypothetical protein